MSVRLLCVRFCRIVGRLVLLGRSAASAAHCPIAANDLDPAITAAIPTASSPANECRRPCLLRGSGTWARSSSGYWLRAAVMKEDVISSAREVDVVAQMQVLGHMPDGSGHGDIQHGHPERI